MNKDISWWAYHYKYGPKQVFSIEEMDYLLAQGWANTPDQEKTSRALFKFEKKELKKNGSSTNSNSNQSNRGSMPPGTLDSGDATS